MCKCGGNVHNSANGLTYDCEDCGRFYTDEDLKYLEVEE